MERGARNMPGRMHAAMRAGGERVHRPASPDTLDGLHDFVGCEPRPMPPPSDVDFLREAGELGLKGTVT